MGLDDVMDDGGGGDETLHKIRERINTLNSHFICTHI